MNQHFSVSDYIRMLGDELVSAFDQGRLGTTPGTIGEARENAVRAKLRQLLPRGIGVGSGFVIDVQGNVSNQMDIIIYEEDICPVFRINDSDAAAYYPCEGVIAIGEVKSTIDSREIDDILSKIRSAKRLRRLAKPRESLLLKGQIVVGIRKYGSTLGISPAVDESYDQDTKGSDQVWGFAIARETRLRPETLADKTSAFCEANGKALAPDLIVTTSGLAVFPVRYDIRGLQSIHSAMDSTGFVTTALQSPLGFLLTRVINAYESGRTVESSAFSEYLTKDIEQGMPIIHYSPIQ